jgi:hypothetical protein
MSRPFKSTRYTSNIHYFLKMILDNLQTKMLHPTWNSWLMLRRFDTIISLVCIMHILNAVKNLIKITHATFVIESNQVLSN